MSKDYIIEGKLVFSHKVTLFKIYEVDLSTLVVGAETPEEAETDLFDSVIDGAIEAAGHSEYEVDLGDTEIEIYKRSTTAKAVALEDLDMKSLIAVAKKHPQVELHSYAHIHPELMSVATELEMRSLGPGIAPTLFEVTE